MGTRNLLRVEPQITSVGDMKSDFIVLQVVFSHIDVVSAGTDKVKRCALRKTRLLCAVGILIPGGAMYKAALLEFLPDLGDVALIGGERKAHLDILELIDFCFCLFREL